MMQKGKRHLIVNSPALPQNQLPMDEDKSESVLTASQVKQLARKGARVFQAVIRLVRPYSTWRGLCRGSVSVCANFVCPT
jgi:hypothetical protein